MIGTSELGVIADCCIEDSKSFEPLLSSIVYSYIFSYYKIMNPNLTSGTWINRLSSELFWDINPESFDFSLHKGWILKRVLEFGRWEDWLLIRDHFDKETLKTEMKKIKLDDKAENFLRHYLCL